MWDDGKRLLWSHVKEFFYDDYNNGVHFLTKITYDHIHLTSYSKMNVKLAAQVLSDTMTKLLSQYGPKEAVAIAKLCGIMDSFFDIVNIRNTEEHIHKRKPNLMSISSPNDIRLSWLTGDFLKYFSDWKSSINSRPEKLTAHDKERMFISRQTYECLKVTAHSIVECVRYLLCNGICDYVLTEKFCQDPLENYFGRQRAIGY